MSDQTNDINKTNSAENESTQASKEDKGKLKRRDLLKGLATIPILIPFAGGWIRKNKLDQIKRNQLASEIKMSYSAPSAKEYTVKPSDKQIRLGIIGFGSRGQHVVRATGFATPEKLKNWYEASQKNKNDKRYEFYLKQDDLNVVINGVCDVFDVHAEAAQKAAANKERYYNDSKLSTAPKRYRNYKDLLNADDIDAVIIATPDHWHAQMIIDAAKAGKHVYTEKAMTRTIEEAFAVRDAVKKSGIIFQLGHQGRQTESYIKAKEAIDKEVIGKISLIEVCTNRNDPNGAWVYPIHPDANEKTIDWQQFLGNAEDKPFNKEHFFRWRCWWDYGTGLSGDLFTHEFDAVNQIIDMGIPKSVMASGGIYYYKDGREVPDVYHAVCEYPDRDLTLMYSATLASDRQRGKVFMGHDGNMDVSSTLVINADKRSTRYKKKIKNDVIDPNIPIYTYRPGINNIDAITSATEAYFAGRGLLYTYRDGKRYDTTTLHVREWLESIRNNVQPSCNIDQGFQEAISAHMGTMSYKTGKRVFWDPEKEKVFTEE